MPEFALVGPSYEAANPLQDSQRLINWFCEIDKGPDAKSVIALLGAPGCESAVTSTYTGEVRGAWVFAGGTKCLWVIGSTAVLMTITTPATATAQAQFSISTVGPLVTSTGPVVMRDNATGGIVALADGPNGYVYNIAANTLTQITDEAWLGSDNIAYIGGLFIFNKPGTQIFYTSPIYWNGVTALDGTYFALKDVGADNLIAHIENQRELWLVGSETTEVWYLDPAATTFPFSRLQGALLQVGCAAKHTLCRTGQGLIWLAKSERGENSVVMTQGYQFAPVSTPAVAYAIAQYDVVDDAFAFIYTEEGHEFYQLTFPTAGVTWVYDLTTDMWHQRSRYDVPTGIHGRHRANCHANFAKQHLIGDFANGQIYRMSRQVFSDGPDPLVSVRRTPHVWDKGERNRVKQSRIQIDFRVGVATSTGQGSYPMCMLRWSNDGGMTWGTRHELSIGKIGETTRRVIKRRLGAARDRVYEVSVSDPVNRDIVGATLRGEATGA